MSVIDETAEREEMMQETTTEEPVRAGTSVILDISSISSGYPGHTLMASRPQRHFQST
jgi:hypothetical protein